jgi:biotin synthase-related radical SAM superfamily protein
MTDSVVNVSIGTAAVLGLVEVPMAVAPTTAYLMLGGRCWMNCAFCAQARESQASALHLSRVTWPEFELGEVLERLPGAVTQGTIRRACLQVTVAADSFEQTLKIVRAVKAVSAVPIDVAILPRDVTQVRHLLEAGVDHIGFGLDAACERVFRRVKGRSWAQALSLAEETAAAFPSRAAVHLIVGLGETEREMVERIQWAHDRGLTVGLFAFTPVRGTHLADRSPPHLATYRRMQAARWLIVHDWAQVEHMTFDAEDQLVQFGASVPIGSGAFRTSGCPDCNRPFYNEQPSGPLYNYPRPLTASEAVQAILEMEVEV